MTIYYVDSASGSNTSPYDTWAKASTTLAAATSLTSTGDTVYVASTHAESDTTVFISVPGVAIICADKTSGAPPTAVATGASITMSQSFTLTAAFVYGITLIESTTSNYVLGVNGYFDTCSFQATGASGTSSIFLGGGFFRNCTFKFGAVGQFMSNGQVTIISGGGVLPGTTTPTYFLDASYQSTIENFDLSNLSNSAALVVVETDSGARFRRCKFPSGWTGALVYGFFGAKTNQYVELIDCDSGATNYKYHRATPFGDIYDEETLVRSGGASDGTTALSWKAGTDSSAGYFPFNALSSSGQKIAIWNDVVGSPRTVTVEFLHDNVTGLKNNEIWIEVTYPADSQDTLGSLVSSAIANVLATPTTYSPSSASWTTTGMSNPNAQSMAVTFTPMMKGFINVQVFVAKTSYTVYVDPKVALA